jgi:nucleoside-diphosphate-sugar epimerase
MKQSQRILITGHNGYIGSVLAPIFARAGHEVVGIDSGIFAECTLVADELAIPALRKDIRDVSLDDLRGFDAVVHLAALSNDPIGNLNPSWTDDINYRATVRLARMAADAGVRRFLLSSSCIMYGMSEAAIVNEQSALDPKTEYARSKVRCEQAISQMASDRFSPTYLRNGTVYGLSPRMRFDTVLNDLVGSALTRGQITIFSDGKPWRPVVHVQDLSRAFLAALETRAERIHNQAFNIGADHLNCQIGALGEIVANAVPGCELRVLAQPGADQRTYRTDFSKFARTFPDFEFHFTAESGARQLCQDFRSLPLTTQLFEDKRFIRLKWLSHLLDTNQLDDRLYWADPHSAASAARLDLAAEANPSLA